MTYVDFIRVKIRAHVFFEGLVQGVFFRVNAQECALSHGLTGWVKNMPDGRVEAVFEGEEGAVDAAIDWCSSRQPHARVERSTVEKSDPTGDYDDFSITH